MSNEERGEYIQADDMISPEADEPQGSYIDAESEDGEPTHRSEDEGAYTEQQDEDGEFVGAEPQDDEGAYTDTDEGDAFDELDDED